MQREKEIRLSIIKNRICLKEEEEEENSKRKRINATAMSNKRLTAADVLPRTKVHIYKMNGFIPLEVQNKFQDGTQSRTNQRKVIEGGKKSANKK